MAVKIDPALLLTSVKLVKEKGAPFWGGEEWHPKQFDPIRFLMFPSYVTTSSLAGGARSSSLSLEQLTVNTKMASEHRYINSFFMIVIVFVFNYVH